MLRQRYTFCERKYIPSSSFLRGLARYREKYRNDRLFFLRLSVTLTFQFGKIARFLDRNARFEFFSLRNLSYIRFEVAESPGIILSVH